MAENNKGLGRFVKWCIVLLFVVLDVALVVSVTAALLAWLFDPFLIESENIRRIISFGWPVLAVAGSVVILRIIARKTVNRFLYETPGPLDLAPFRYAGYLVLSLICLVIALELILTAADIREPLPVYASDEEAASQLKTGGFIEPDPFLLWKFAAGSNYTHGTINETGYLGKAPAQTKSEQTKRVICLGGTSTCRATPSYPRLLEAKLNEVAEAPINWEVYDYSVERYSIVQGLEVFRSAAKSQQADYVVLYFGWDDHWRSGKPDSRRMAVRKTSESQTWLSRMGKRRFIQIIDNSMNSERNTARKDNPNGLRVPLGEYTWVLNTLIHEITSAGATPVLIIPPGDGLSQDLVTSGLVSDLEKARELHTAYNQAAREVAKQTKCPLVDFEEYIAVEVPTRFAIEGRDPVSLFEEDGMTLSELGRTFLIEQLLLKLH